MKIERRVHPAVVVGIVCALAVLLAARPAAAQPAPAPVGSNFMVNETVTDTQLYAKIAMEPNGNFVVVWESPDADGAGLFGKRFFAQGTDRGSEFAVNSLTTSGQNNASVGVDANGNFVVAWRSSAFPGGYDSDIVARRFDAAGAAIGGDFLVNSFTTGTQYAPSVATDPAGNFVVAWVSYTNIYFQQFYDTGLPQGGETPVDVLSYNNRQNPEVDAAATGDFVVAWQEYYGYGQYAEVLARRFYAGGAPNGSTFLVNQATALSQEYADVAIDASGDFVVAWQGNATFAGPPPYWDVLARRVDSSSGFLSGDLLVNNVNTGVHDQRAAVAVAPDGKFVVAWERFDLGGFTGLHVAARVFDENDLPYGAEFLPSSYTSPIYSQRRPDVAVDDAGNFVVVWDGGGYGDSYGIFAQRYLGPCHEEMTLVQDRWHLIGLPCEPAAGERTVLHVFGDDLGAADYGFTWVVYKWDETQMPPAYVLVPNTEDLEMGRGYWIKTILTDRPIDVDGHNAPYDCDPSSTTVARGGCLETYPLVGTTDMGASCQDSDLSDGVFNLLGHPFRRDISLAGTRFADNGTELTPEQAEAANIASDQIWTWGGASYQAADSCTPGMEAQLSKWDGFWIDVCLPTTPLSLRISSRDSQTCGSPPPPPVGPEGELVGEAGASREPAAGTEGPRRPRREFWYLRLVVTADGLTDPGNVLGEIEDSVMGYDSHDLVELQPFTSPYLTVVFPHLDWGTNSSEWYTSDYHGFGDPREWAFEVRSDQARTATLTWELTGDPKVMRRMELVDTVSGVIVPAEAGSYTFTMAAPTHGFVWHEARGGGHRR